MKVRLVNHRFGLFTLTPQIFKRLCAFLPYLCLLALSQFLQGCFQTSVVKNPVSISNANLGASVLPSPSVSVSPSPGASPDLLNRPLGVKAVRFILKSTADNSGSFPEAPQGGTASGSGFAASRVFNLDNTLLSAGPDSETWPKWISRFEVGISGENNASAKSPDCARFANDTDETASCGNTGGAGTPCGAPKGYYRVSEFDCARAEYAHDSNTIQSIFIRAKIDRTGQFLGAGENLIVNIEYSAAGTEKGPKDPRTCAKSGFADPACTEQLWSVFMMQNPGDSVTPFYMLIPPVLQYSGELLSNTQPASALSTKQIMIPLNSFPTAQWIHIGRVFGPTKGSSLCLGTNSGAGLSPLCSGSIFYTVTIMRL